ncbi:hypothetical protein AWS52_10835 [Enterobacter cloacae subsp. cloacae]|nr:hypothetical protein AWS52_10835 [Enterobacter cloacae subsp. cloacae]
MDVKLIDILVRELPKLGGWPIGADRIYQNAKGHLVGVQGCIISPVDMELAILAEDLHKSVAREQYEAALAASKPEWNGEGLPPVGMEIEYKFTKVNYRTDFSRGKVLAYGMHNVFMEHWSSKNEFIQPLDKIEFRPIRSEAEKKRDLIISKIEKAYKDCPHSDAVPQAIYEAIAEHIRID